MSTSRLLVTLRFLLHQLSINTPSLLKNISYQPLICISLITREVKHSFMFTGHFSFPSPWIPCLLLFILPFCLLGCLSYSYQNWIFKIYCCLRASKGTRFSEGKHDLMPQSKWISCLSQSWGQHTALCLCCTPQIKHRKLPVDKLVILSSKSHMPLLSSST
jgi:hypothetical protein